MLKNLAWVFAVVFVVVGVLGFVPGITTDGHFLGIFEVDTLHNLIHLVSGIVAAAVALSSAKNQKLYFQIFGVVYAAVAVVGLVQGDTVLGLIATNMADHILHVVLALVLLYAGFVWKDKGMVGSTPAPMKTM